MAAFLTRMRITFALTLTRITGRVWTTTNKTEIGVQQKERVLTAEPMELSLTNSGLISAGKVKNRVKGRVW